MIVLTYHPAFFKVHEILRNCSNTLFVDDKHRNLFQNKMFISFRRAKNLKDTLPGESEKTWGVWRTVTSHLGIRLS